MAGVGQTEYLASSNFATTISSAARTMAHASMAWSGARLSAARTAILPTMRELIVAAGQRVQSGRAVPGEFQFGELASSNEDTDGDRV